MREEPVEPGDAELFRAQMLIEMAAMSLDDGLVLQLHAGSWRNTTPTSPALRADKGADIPTPMDYVGALKPLLDRFGNEPGLTIVVYTLDEGTYSRELAPLAGHYPALRLGPPWWFHDSPEGIRRFRQLVTETAGFANTVGFNDDARSLLTIPARHDVARRIDAGYLAGLVAEHRLEEDEAFEVAEDLAYRLARRTFRIGDGSGPGGLMPRPPSGGGCPRRRWARSAPTSCPPTTGTPRRRSCTSASARSPGPTSACTQTTCCGRVVRR